VAPEFHSWGGAIDAALPDDGDASDGSLDPDPLRKAGRLKVVVRNPRQTPPDAVQQAAWRAFRDSGAATAERIASALLETYRRQRPQRVRWWRALYGDSPDGTLPDVATPPAMRNIIRPKEFRVYPPQGGVAAVGVVMESLWCDTDIEVRLRDGAIVSVGPVPAASDVASSPGEAIESPVFGRLRYSRSEDRWEGRFRSEALRGYHEAAKLRWTFKRTPKMYPTPYRPGPPWDVITGEFDLHVDSPDGDPPAPAQAAAFAAFNADPAATAGQVLAAVLDWYQGVRPDYVENMNGSPAEIAATMPDLRSPEGLLEIIQLQSVRVLAPSDPDETDAGAAGGGAAVPIVLSFAWEDEHGLAVRWRDGNVEQVGDSDSIEDE
jgi:hypothetical protein